MKALYVPQLFESDGNLDAIGRLCGVKSDIGLLRRHDIYSVAGSDV
jgi:hypothetical protein